MSKESVEVVAVLVGSSVSKLEWV